MHNFHYLKNTSLPQQHFRYLSNAALRLQSVKELARQLQTADYELHAARDTQLVIVKPCTSWR